MNKKIIAPIAIISATFAMAVGTTYAMFTRNVSKTVSVTSGEIDVSLDMSMSEALSRYSDETPFDAMANAVALGSEHDAVFELTGTGDLDEEDGELTLDRIAPTDQVTTKVSATNASNISIKWRFNIELAGDLIPALDVKFGNQVIDTSSTDTTIYGSWSDVVLPSVTELIPETNLVVTFPDRADNNDYQDAEGSIKLVLETVQGNMEVRDNVCAVSTKDELMSYVAGWNNGTETRSLQLDADIDISDVNWSPLGTWKNPYHGYIYGDGHTITGLGKGGIEGYLVKSDEYAVGFIGIAGSTVSGEDLTITNLKLTDAKLSVEDSGAPTAILLAYAPVTSDFNSNGEGIGSGNFELNNLHIEKVSVDGEISAIRSSAGLVGKIYSHSAEIINNNVDVDVTVKKDHIAELIGYVNYTTSLLVKDNILAGSIYIPAGDHRADDEVVIATFMDTYIIESNTSTTKLYLDGIEIDDPVKISNEYNEDGSVKSVNVVWDGKDLKKNQIVAAHGSEKLRITLKNSALNNDQAIMTNQATDNVIVTLDNFSTTGNISVANLILKGDCNIANSYTTAKKTLLCEGGEFNKVTIDANGTAIMTGGKITNFTANEGASITLNGCEVGTIITLAKGSSLTTGDGFVPSTVDNYTVKVHVNANSGTTIINGVPCETGGTDLYFLAE